jgi:hypothetical protein
MAQMVKISVSVDKDKLRLAKAQAKDEGVSLSSLLARGLQHELDARARLQAALELYGPDGWPTPEERRRVVDSWTTRAPKRRAKRRAA